MPVRLLLYTLLFGGLARAEEPYVLPPSAVFPNSTSSARDMINLDVNVSYELTRDGPSLQLRTNVSVPYLKTNSTYCPGFYLIDFTDPISPIDPGTQIDYIATHDAMGAARSACSAINYTYNASNFNYPDATPAGVQYKSVSDAWNVTFSENHATYQMSTPMSLNFMQENCGVSSDKSFESLLNVNYVVTKYHWTLYVCQVGYYGPFCKSSMNEYAASCVRHEAAALVSPLFVSAASAPQPTTGHIVFLSFETSSETCQEGHARGIVHFQVAFDKFDLVVDFRYISPPHPSLGGLYTPAPFVLERGVYMHNKTSSNSTMDTWNLTIVTECVAFPSAETFAHYFGNANTSIRADSHFKFSVYMENVTTHVTTHGEPFVSQYESRKPFHIMLQIAVSYEALVAMKENTPPSAPPPISPAPTPPQNENGNEKSGTRVWPWWIPSFMTVNIISTFTAAILL